MAKAAFNRKTTLFSSKLELDLRIKFVKCSFGAFLSMLLKRGHFERSEICSRKVLKCGAGEGWRTVGPIL